MVILWLHADDGVSFLVFPETECDCYRMWDFHFFDRSAIDKCALQCPIMDYD